MMRSSRRCRLQKPARSCQRSRRRPSLLTVVTVFVTLLHACQSTDSAIELLPQPDLTGVERQVVEKIQQLRLQVEQNPKSADAWGRLAMVLDIHDFKKEALPCYRRAIEIRPDEFRWVYYYAIVLSETGSPEARQWFERARSLKPDYAPLYVLQGRALYESGRLEEAEAAFTHALSLDDSLPHACLGLGQIALARGDLEKSREWLDRTLQLEPNYREAHGLLAEVFRRLNKPQSAERERQRAEKLPKITPLQDPVYEELVAQGVSAFWYRERGLVYQGRGQIPQAVQEFKMALQLKPDPKGHKYVADLLCDLGRFEEAVGHYKTAIAVDPNYVTAYESLGQVLWRLGQQEEARLWLERALRVQPDFVQGYLTLAFLQAKSGQDAEAMATLRRGLRLTGGAMGLLLRLAWLLATSPNDDLRDGAEAVRFAQAINQQLNYSDPEALDVLAAAYAETGQFAKAAQTAERAHQIAISRKQTELAAEIRARRTLFESGQPFRQRQN